MCELPPAPLATKNPASGEGGNRSHRNRRSAKKAGSSFERLVADYLAVWIDERIDRRVKTGSKDRGDISGLRHLGQRVVIECKNTTRTNLARWAAETDLERGNDDAVAGLIVHKRHGRAAPAEQWVTLTLGELVSLLTGSREHYQEN